MEKLSPNNNLTEIPSVQTRADTLSRALLNTISPAFLDAEQATRWLVHRLHPHGPACPHCGCPVASPRRRATWEVLGRVKCTGCGRTFSAISRTPLSGSTLSPRAVLLMALLLLGGHDHKTVAARVGCDRSTVNRWRPLLLEGGL